MCTLEEAAGSVPRIARGHEVMSKRFGEMVPSLTLADLQTKIAIFEISVAPGKPTYVHAIGAVTATGKQGG